MVTNYIFKNEIKMHMQLFAELTKTMAGFENISKKLTNSVDKFYEKVVKSFERDSCSLNSFCHGDLWLNNVMFKCNENNDLPIEAILVDFQFCYWGPVIVDITSILYTSSDETFRHSHWDELIQYYHSELIKSLKKFNYCGTLPTLTDLHAQIIQRGISTIANGLYEFSSRGKTADVNVTDLMGDSLDDDAIRKRLKMIEDAKNCEGFKFMLNYFDRRGYFD